MDSYAKLLEPFILDPAVTNVELIYTPHPNWPLPLVWDASRSNEEEKSLITLSVLDSSFNPPTLAHLALARLPSSAVQDVGYPAFDAKLLLFSLKNADKTQKPEDATPAQRLEMMVLLAGELHSIRELSENNGSQNIAVAVCREPTFVGKSTALKSFLRERLETLSSQAHVQLTFLLGFDTLERLFAPKYYGSESTMRDELRRVFSSSEDHSRVFCARRTSGTSYSEVNDSVLDTAADFIDSGAMVLFDIGETERTLSSSEVREIIRNGSNMWEPKVPITVAKYIKENHLYAQR